MGKEARVIAEIGEWAGEGKLLLETDELVFRGAMRLKINVADITQVSEEDGWLIVTHAGGETRFDIGPAFAPKWVTAILNPRTRIDKFDVKTTSHVMLVGVVDLAFLAEIRARGATVAAAEVGASEMDLVFLHADEPQMLERIPALKGSIKSAGAVWVLHPRGRRDLSHDAIMAVAKPAGLVDVKSARFDDTLGALKLMAPREERV